MSGCGQTAVIAGKKVTCVFALGHEAAGHTDGLLWWDDDGYELLVNEFTRWEHQPTEQTPYRIIEI